jgi:hypothetical protein
LKQASTVQCNGNLLLHVQGEFPASRDIRSLSRLRVTPVYYPPPLDSNHFIYDGMTTGHGDRAAVLPMFALGIGIVSFLRDVHTATHTLHIGAPSWRTAG